jgi:hypothetical protein
MQKVAPSMLVALSPVLKPHYYQLSLSLLLLLVLSSGVLHIG